MLFIVRPSKNSLQNRYLPMDLIQTDCTVILDDDVRISNLDYSLGFRQDQTNNVDKLLMTRALNFRTWQANPSKILGFETRRVSQGKKEEFKYSDTTCEYNIILHPMFIHRFYLYVS